MYYYICSYVRATYRPLNHSELNEVSVGVYKSDEGTGFSKAMDDQAIRRNSSWWKRF